MDRIVPANQSDIIIRDAADEDAPFFENLYFQTRRDEFAALGWDENQLRMFLKMQFNLQTQGYLMQFPNARISVIESGETAVGRLLTDDTDAEEIRLIDIAVLPESRSRGVGSFVMSALETQARQANKSIGLQVLKTNAPAIRLYERFGFNVVGENDLYLEMQRIAAAETRG